jgi:hypothetical protein
LLRFLAQRRVEVMGGTYNEPNTNLTGAETSIRNFVHGIGFQRDVLGADPATAWQLDVFGHDPQFPGMAADAGLTSSSWARGPHHQWGPMAGGGDPRRMQFRSEFEWIAPSGVGLLTHYMPAHYAAGWWMDSSTSLAEAEAREQQRQQLQQSLRTAEQAVALLAPQGLDELRQTLHTAQARAQQLAQALAAQPAGDGAALPLDARHYEGGLHRQEPAVRRQRRGHPGGPPQGLLQVVLRGPAADACAT